MSNPRVVKGMTELLAVGESSIQCRRLKTHLAVPQILHTQVHSQSPCSPFDLLLIGLKSWQ